MLSLWEKGKTQKQIANTLEINQPTVFRIIRDIETKTWTVDLDKGVACPTSNNIRPTSTAIPLKPMLGCGPSKKGGSFDGNSRKIRRQLRLLWRERGRNTHATCV